MPQITIDTDKLTFPELQRIMTTLCDEVQFGAILDALALEVKQACGEALNTQPEYQRLHALVLQAQSYADRHGI